MTLKGREAAYFLLGYYSALVQRGRKIPKYLQEAACEARDIVTGGSFRGPLAIYDMERVANKLARSAAEKVR